MYDLTWNHDHPRTVSDPVETDHGVFRAVIEHDDFPMEPDFDYGCPVIRVDPTGHGNYRLTMTGYGSASAKRDGLDIDIEDALSRTMDGGETGYGMALGLHEAVDHVSRWLATFHGGSAVMVDSPTYRDYGYITYDTRAMREFWGQAGDDLETSEPEADEWMAYIRGDVYFVGVEQATFDGDDIDWHETDDGMIGGHYGDDWAEQSAAEMLELEIRYRASQMLPIE